MTLEQIIDQYSGLSRERQIQCLADYGYALTITARETYEVGTGNGLDSRKLRAINELQHRVLGHLCMLLNGADKRFPDDVLVKVITGEGDQDLAEVFAGTLQNTRASRP